MSQSVVKHVDDAVFGVVESDTGAIRADRGNYRNDTHAGKGMTHIHGSLWRYRDSTRTVHWWERPDRIEEEAVVGWLSRHGYEVKGSLWLQKCDANRP